MKYPEPNEIFAAVNAAAFDEDGNYVGRDQATQKIAAFMYADKWRFNSDYRHEKTSAHSLIYNLIAPVAANDLADQLI